MIYSTWETTALQIPPRRRFHKLEPIGFGTAVVESLTSYVARLAEAHCVSSQALIRHGCFPLLDKAYLDKPRGSLDVTAHGINGMGSIAGDCVRTLEAITSYEGLRFSTALPWKAVLSELQLLRRKLAWCPICLECKRTAGEMIYSPLLWAFQAVTVCPAHRCLLESVCQHCKKEPKVLSRTSLSGYCSQCQKWLGCDSDDGQTDPIFIEAREWYYRVWVSKSIGELIVAASTLPSPPSREGITESLSQCIDRIHRFGDGKFSLFSRYAQIKIWTVRNWRGAGDLPGGPLLLKMCHSLGISLLDFLTGRIPVNVPIWNPKQFSHEVLRELGL